MPLLSVRTRWRTGPVGPALYAACALAGPPAAAETVRVAAFGDYGVNTAYELAVANLIDSFDPDAVVTTGDNSYDEGPVDDNVGKYYAHYIGDYRGSWGAGAIQNRFFPALGNHDYGDGGGVGAYLDYFTLPGTGITSTGTSGTETYYDFVLGPVHFFALDSNVDQPDGVSPTSVQGAWLQARLAASESPWKVVYFHHCPYSSGWHGSTSRMQWPFREWGATATIAGHDHEYERVTVDGLPHFVVGTGGRPLRSFEGTPVPGSAVRYNADHGALLLTADETSIKFEFYSVGGELVDSYTIGTPAVPDVDVQPDSVDFGIVPLDSTSARTVTVRNAGAGALRVVSTRVVGDSDGVFSITEGVGPFTLGAAESTGVVVEFAPASPGSRDAILRLTTDDPDESVRDVPLSGNGVSLGPYLDVEPELVFEPVRVGGE